VIRSEGPHDALQPGLHRFLWSLIIPSSTAPSENASYGDIRHRLEVRASGLGSFGGTIRDYRYVGMSAPAARVSG